MPDPDLLERAKRSFCAEDHIVNVYEGERIPLVREDGSELIGITGTDGAFGATIDGTEIGGDLIVMQPGSSFGTHVHVGDHLLFCVRGEGQVYIDGELRPWREGDTVFIAADLPHGVTTYAMEHFEAQGLIRDEYLGVDRASGRDVGLMTDSDGRRAGEFVILAVGVPHKHVDDPTRMKLVSEAEEQHAIARMRALERGEEPPPPLPPIA